MADEALTNKEESREALAFIARLVVIPLVTGALISRAITDPVLSFSLQVGRERPACQQGLLCYSRTPAAAADAAMSGSEVPWIAATFPQHSGPHGLLGCGRAAAWLQPCHPLQPVFTQT